MQTKKRRHKIFPNQWFLVAMATFLLIIVSCGSPIDLSFNCDTSDIPKVEDGKNLNNLTIAIYVDGTPSMEGYVASNSESNYMKTIDLVDGVVSSINLRPNKSETKYYRLGPDVKEQSRDQYIKAKLPEFYNGKSPQFPSLKVSQIEKSITPPDANKDKLTIIFTDLYQKDADITNISNAIKNNYIDQKRPGYAVGILGVKSDFNGTIYDIGVSGKSLKYKGIHPFYVMFIGRYTDIKTVFDSLKDQIKYSEKVIFYPDNIVTQVSSLQEFPVISEENKETLDRPDSLKFGSFSIEKKNQIDLLEVDQKATKKVNLTYKASFQPTSYTLTPNSIEPTMKIQSIDTAENKLIDSPDAKLKEALQASSFQINENKISFNVGIDPNKFDNTGIYAFTIDAKVKDLQDQKWWKSWNTDQENDGSRTNNLDNFLKRLKLITQNNQLIVGRFCYAIQKN